MTSSEAIPIAANRIAPTIGRVRSSLKRKLEIFHGKAPATALGTPTRPDDGPVIVGMHDMERHILHESPEHAAASTWIAPAAPPMYNQISSLPRTIPRSRSSSGWLWVLRRGLLAFAVVGWIMRPDPATSDRAAGVPPELRQDLDRALASPLTDLSEDEVRAYRTEWASHLNVDEGQLIGDVAIVLIPSRQVHVRGSRECLRLRQNSGILDV